MGRLISYVVNQVSRKGAKTQRKEPQIDADNNKQVTRVQEKHLRLSAFIGGSFLCVLAPLRETFRRMYSNSLRNTPTGLEEPDHAE